jgi:cell division protein FtsQ
VIEAGGASGDGEVSRDDAAGDSPTSHANAPYRSTPYRSRVVHSWRIAFYGLALVGLAGFAAWALFDSQLLAVRSVVVTGTHLVPASEVLAIAGVEPGTPLIRLNTGQVAARVDTIRQVRGAQVTRSWPDRVVIAVRERTPALAVPAPGGGFDLVDATGVIVLWAATKPGDLPLYPATVPVTLLRGDPDLGAAAAVLGELPAALRSSVESLTAPSPDQVTLQLAGGITVVWGGTGGTSAKSEELGVLMRTHSHYYDVSAQGTVAIK